MWFPQDHPFVHLKSQPDVMPQKGCRYLPRHSGVSVKKVEGSSQAEHREVISQPLFTTLTHPSLHPAHNHLRRLQGVRATGKLCGFLTWWFFLQQR